jgi:ParB-like chromosome segregation protein Spo0J
MYLAIDSILIDELYYPRNELGWRQIQNYVSALRTGATFPPIVVGKRNGRYVLIDGRHRYEAFKRTDNEKIPAMLTKLPESEWFAEAVRLNSSHGHPLSFQERIKAAMVLQKQKFSLDKIEKIVAIQSGQLQELIEQRGHWVHPEDIRPVVVKTAIAATAASRGRKWLEQEAARIEQKQEALSGHRLRYLVADLVTLLDGDLIDEVDVELVIKLRESVNNWLKSRVKA